MSILGGFLQGLQQVQEQRRREALDLIASREKSGLWQAEPALPSELKSTSFFHQLLGGDRYRPIGGEVPVPIGNRGGALILRKSPRASDLPPEMLQSLGLDPTEPTVKSYLEKTPAKAFVEPYIESQTLGRRFEFQEKLRTRSQRSQDRRAITLKLRSAGASAATPEEQAALAEALEALRTANPDDDASWERAVGLADWALTNVGKVILDPQTNEMRPAPMTPRPGAPATPGPVRERSTLGVPGAPGPAPEPAPQAASPDVTQMYQSMGVPTDLPSVGVLTPEQMLATTAVANRLGMAPEHLFRIMAFETAGTFSPSKKNPLSTATGLIQFTEAAANQLGTTTDELARMPYERQLQYVERYLAPYKGRMSSLQDAYLAVLKPAAIGAGPETVLFQEGSREYDANRMLDTDGSGAITIAEATAVVARYGKGRPPSEPLRTETTPLGPQVAQVPGAPAVAAPGRVPPAERPPAMGGGPTVMTRERAEELQKQEYDRRRREAERGEDVTHRQTVESRQMRESVSQLRRDTTRAIRDYARADPANEGEANKLMERMRGVKGSDAAAHDALTEIYDAIPVTSELVKNKNEMIKSLRGQPGTDQLIDTIRKATTVEELDAVTDELQTPAQETSFRRLQEGMIADLQGQPEHAALLRDIAKARNRADLLKLVDRLPPKPGRAGKDAEALAASDRKDLANLRVLKGQTREAFELGQKPDIQKYQGRFAGGPYGWLREFTGKATEDEVLFRTVLRDMSDQLLRSRSGASTTEREYARLATLLPRPSDPPHVFRIKLQRFTALVDSLIAEREKAAVQPKSELGGGRPRTGEKVMDIAPKAP